MIKALHPGRLYLCLMNEFQVKCRRSSPHSKVKVLTLKLVGNSRVV